MNSAAGIVLGVALCFTTSLWLIRTCSALHLDRPYLGCTSGCEEEALFSVWKVTHGFPAYTSPWLPPFSHSYFGWLFYELYGLWCKFWMRAAGLGDAWLPTIARSLTLLGFFACIGVYYRLIKEGLKDRFSESRTLSLGFAALVFINPLFDWWSFTVRPDIWALVFELAALLAAFRYAESKRPIDFGSVAVATYLAWSFRPTNISILLAVGLWLLLARSWKPLVVLITIMGMMFGLTVLVKGQNFIDNMFVANSVSGQFLVIQAKIIAYSALTKNPLLTLAILVMFALLLQKQTWWKEQKTRMAFLAATTSLILALSFSCKVGAGFNYYYPSSAFVPLFVWMTLGSNKNMMIPKRLFVAFGAMGAAITCILIFLGISGNLVHQSDEKIYQLIRHRTELDEPIFSTHRPLNLPWLLGSGPDSLVFGYAYDQMLKARPESFTQGTLSSLLQQGKIGTVILIPDNSSYQPSPQELAPYRTTRMIYEAIIFQK